MPNVSHTREDLKALQAKPLDEKIQISTARIIEWYEYWHGQAYVSFSGGKDSTVLLDLVRKIYPDVPAVFSDTGLEFPELREFVLTTSNLRVVQPTMNFVEVIKRYGYPIVTKSVSSRVHRFRHAKTQNGFVQKIFDGTYTKNGTQPSQYNIPQWKFLLDADFRISDKCCEVMKKSLMHRYEKETGRHPYIGVMAFESRNRRANWLKYGCNAFDRKGFVQSTPMAFWQEQDILQYIQRYRLRCASVYGELVEFPTGKLQFTGCKRTGCVFCGYGCHLEKEPNRFQHLAITHPNLYDYCMRGGKFDEQGMWIPDKGLGMAKVLDYINVKWWNTDEQRDTYRTAYQAKEKEHENMD